MSLIGVDVGTSAVKAIAYGDSGARLASARRDVPGRHPEPGRWEVDVDDAMRSLWHVLASVASEPAVRADPPVGLAVSSSGREVFPVSAEGTPLGPCLMTADTRGDDIAAAIAGRRRPEEWFMRCGHVPRRMDPVSRALWWRREHPDVVARTRWFMNWHEFVALALCGTPVVDSSDAGTWAVYDIDRADWSPVLIDETGVDAAWLSEIRPSGMSVGPILPAVARRLGLPGHVTLVTGAYDTMAAAVGSGSVDRGVVALACGTWHTFTTPVDRGWPVALVHDGLNVCPQPGPSGFAIQAADPNGMSVVDWARRLLGVSVDDLDAGLSAAGPEPGYVTADPRFTPMPHTTVRPGFGGRLEGLTLSTGPTDLIRALLEAIACRLSSRLDLLRGHGIEPRLIRASGGGSRSDWWMQLHADVSGVPVEVVTQEEPGAFGAAILAGLGVGLYPSVQDAVERLVTVARRFEPDAARGAAYAPLRRRAEEGDR